MRALIAGLDALAERLGCTAIRAMVLGQTSLVAAGRGDWKESLARAQEALDRGAAKQKLEALIASSKMRRP